MARDFWYEFQVSPVAAETADACSYCWSCGRRNRQRRQPLSKSDACLAFCGAKPVISTGDFFVPEPGFELSCSHYVRCDTMASHSGKVRAEIECRLDPDGSYVGHHGGTAGGKMRDYENFLSISRHLEGAYERARSICWPSPEPTGYLVDRDVGAQR